MCSWLLVEILTNFDKIQQKWLGRRENKIQMSIFWATYGGTRVNMD